MPKFLPEGKTYISVRTRGFPGRENDLAEYEFGISCRNVPFVLDIKGEHRGPDNCEPASKEQENWLDELETNSDNKIKRIWDCEWEIADETALRKFLHLLEPFIIETKYY